MYTKLAVRNARRSASDYLLYITTLIILSALMMFSNLLASASSQNGLQASSVPLFISLVMVALLGYINDYMLRRRSKEFATYILLGMKKNKIAVVFFGESFLLGIIGLFIGMMAGSLCFFLILSFLSIWFPIDENMLIVYGTAVRDSIIYFLTIQGASLLVCLWKVRKMQIRSLMSEGRKNQALKSIPCPFFWSALCMICLITILVLIYFITNGNDNLMMFGANIIIIPLVFGIWAFYKASFHWLAWLRINRRSKLYQGNRLYLAAQLLSKISSNITLNTVLSVCLLFSFITFSAGLIMPNIPVDLFSEEISMWMAFAQICMCIVFTAIYFSVLAVRQIIEVKENSNAYRVMAYLGTTGQQRRRVIKKEIILKYTFPVVMCLLILLLCVTPINSLLNTFLLTSNLLYIAIGCFAGCFLFMYMGYTFIAYKLCVKNVL